MDTLKTLINSCLVVVMTTSCCCKTNADKGIQETHRVHQTSFPAHSTDLTIEYKNILDRIGVTPSSLADPWSLSYDHIFSGFDHADVDQQGTTLRQACEIFVRKNGAIEFLFARVIALSTSDDELFKIAEILTFWIGVDEPIDASIIPINTNDFLKALNDGRADQLDDKYPNLWLKGRLYAAAKKIESSDKAGDVGSK
jgi:hypothetical protein